MPSPKKKATNTTGCAIDRSNNKDASRKTMSSSRERWPSKSSMPSDTVQELFFCTFTPAKTCGYFSSKPADQHPPLRSPMIDLSYFDKYQRGPATQGICWPTWLSDSSIQASLLEKKKTGFRFRTGLSGHANTHSPAGFVRSARRQSSRHHLARISRDNFLRADKGYPSNRTAASTTIANAPERKRMKNGERPTGGGKTCS